MLTGDMDDDDEVDGGDGVVRLYKYVHPGGSLDN